MASLVVVGPKQTQQTQLAPALHHSPQSTRLDALRAASTSSAESLTEYYLQLSLAASKLPHDIGVAFPWCPLYSTTPLSLSSLLYERVCVLFNIAAHHASSAASVNQADPSSLRSSISSFQTSAAVFIHLRDKILPPLLQPSLPQPSADLTPQSLTLLSSLSLAQAQELAWRKAVVDRLKNATIAKLSRQVSIYYNDALTAYNDLPDLAFIFPYSVISTIRLKAHHFHAAAQYRKSCDDLADNRYGHEVSRLTDAANSLKKALSFASSAIKQSLINDVKSLQSTVSENLTRAKHDNDVIYLQIVPSLDSLPAITPASMVSPTLPIEIENPIKYLFSNKDGIYPIFKDLPPYGIHLAINVYQDRRNSHCDDLKNTLDKLDDDAKKFLNGLNLPASIQALDTPIGLPPSLLRHAQHIADQQGPATLRCMTDDIHSLSHSAHSLLENATSILVSPSQQQQEHQSPNISNKGQELFQKLQEFTNIIKNAATSDQRILDDFSAWEDKIVLLSSGPEKIEASIPPPNTSYSSSSSSEQVLYARTLRGLLERLDDLNAANQSIRAELEHTLKRDNISSQLLSYWNDRLANDSSSYQAHQEQISPSEFEDVFTTNLSKYDHLEREITRTSHKQDTLLAEVSRANDKFINARKSDQSIKHRQHSLQNLYDAADAYSSIRSDLQSGVDFYNRFIKLLNEFVQDCKSFTQMRSEFEQEQERREQERQQQQEQEQELENNETSSKSPTPIQPGKWDSSMPLRFG